MKIITIIAALAALPLTAQEQAPTTEQQQPMQCSCARQQSDAAQNCPQAAMAAAYGFQRGYHTGFEAGFAEAINIIQKAGVGCSACSGHGKRCRHGKPEGPKEPRPTPPPAAPQAAPQVAPQAGE